MGSLATMLGVPFRARGRGRRRGRGERMALTAGGGGALLFKGELQSGGVRIFCRKREKEKDNRDHHPYHVVEITPPPTNLGVRCFPSNMQCGESVTIEGKYYTISAVTHRYQLKNGRYKPSEKRLDVQSASRYILNLYLENLLDKS